MAEGLSIMLGRGQGLRVGVWPAPRPPVPSSPRLGEALTSAWPPGVSVLLQCSHLRQNLCQSLPRELTFSAGQVGAQGQNAGCLEGLVLLPEQSFCIWFAVLMESPLASSG